MNTPSEAANPWIQWQQALLNEGSANLRRMARLPQLWQKAVELKKGATPSEVVYEQGRLRVLHYQGQSAPAYPVPLLFVFALVNRPYILDLKQGRSVISHFVNQGFDTYLLDWGSPTRAERYLSLDHYINGYLADVVNFLRRRTGAPRVSLLGYCMGGTMSAIFTALHPESVRNLMLLAAGINFATCDGLLNLWTQPQYFDVDKFVD
ncbi:MAG TPA: alpha/beta fold hydrolase, partial [Candidatus Angelobacter sp.]|nr:alpha/beta fold hydrolase [Candidatus Angelobacter sp.]